MRFSTIVGLCLLVVILSVSCAGKRPCGKQDKICGHFTQIEKIALPGELISASIQTLVDSKEDQGTVNVLSLSAGGQYGAFGAGFVIGWYRTDMPYFDVVTSVSTGSLLAPFVFLLSGESNYKEEIVLLLHEVYGDGLEDSKIFEGEILPNLINKKALYDRAPLRKLLERELKDEYLDEIAEQYKREHSKRFLLVGVANLDTGNFRIVNLSKVASKYTGKKRQKLFINTIMASSAVPVIFSPEFINGQMYVDGGAREYVIFETVEEGVDMAYLNLEEKIEPVKTFYMIVHGEYLVKNQCTSYNPIDIATRSMTIVLDQTLRVSVFYNAYLAEKKGWAIKVLSAKDHKCMTSSAEFELFDPVFTKCLYDTGMRLGFTKDKDVQEENEGDKEKFWITSSEDLAIFIEKVKGHKEDKVGKPSYLDPEPTDKSPDKYGMCKP